MTETTLLNSALGVLAGVILTLWRIISANHKDTKEKCERLEDRQEKATEMVSDLKEELGEMRGELKIAKEIHPKLDEIKKGVDDLVSGVLKGVSDE